MTKSSECKVYCEIPRFNVVTQIPDLVRNNYLVNAGDSRKQINPKSLEENKKILT